jgi:hypothetical protein
VLDGNGYRLGTGTARDSHTTEFFLKKLTVAPLVKKQMGGGGHCSIQRILESLEKHSILK